MEQTAISLTKRLSIDDDIDVFKFHVDFTFFDSEFSWLFIFRFDATVASGGFADSVMLKTVSLGQFIRAVLKSDDLSKNDPITVPNAHGRNCVG